MGISENQYYRLSGVCGIVAVVLALLLGWILGVGRTEILCLLAGILAAVALFLEVLPPLRHMRSRCIVNLPLDTTLNLTPRAAHAEQDLPAVVHDLRNPRCHQSRLRDGGDHIYVRSMWA
jgi:hypothetical protein